MSRPYHQSIESTPSKISGSGPETDNFPLCPEKTDDDDNLPSMDTLEISEKKNIQSISTYFGGEEEDIPDMAEFDETDDLVENDPVS